MAYNLCIYIIMYTNMITVFAGKQMIYFPDVWIHIILSFYA